MPFPRHCRHCWGDCPGDCMLPGQLGQDGSCIHRAFRRLSFRQWIWLRRQRLARMRETSR